MQLRLDAADRLVDLLEERHSPLRAVEAVRETFALSHVPDGLARTLLDDVVAADSRLAWNGSAVGLAAHDEEASPIEAATYVVVDLETTGLRPGRAAICEIGAVRLRGLDPAGTFQTLVDPGQSLPAKIVSLTGLADPMLRDAPRASAAVRDFLDFAGDCVLVAHNARFDLGFLNREVEHLSGRRLAAPVIDTVWLARKLLGERTRRTGLASLAQFFGTSVTPCHRALPDAQATAEVLVALIGIAQERGATTVADLCRLAAPRQRRVYRKRSLAHGAPPRPGVYFFRDSSGAVLYVGRARDLRARLRSYFRTPHQRPAVEAALEAAARIEWHVHGSELEAALAELRLIRELKPPANVRSRFPERYVYLRRKVEGVSVTSQPTELGPIRSRRRAELAARALDGATGDELDRLLNGEPPARLRQRLRNLSESLRYEEAARLRDRIAALESVQRDLNRLRQLRQSELLIIVPAVDPGIDRLIVVAKGRVAATRSLPNGSGRDAEIERALMLARSVEASVSPSDSDELLLIGSFLRRPPPELRVLGVASELDEAFGRHEAHLSSSYGTHFGGHESSSNEHLRGQAGRRGRRQKKSARRRP